MTVYIARCLQLFALLLIIFGMHSVAKAQSEIERPLVFLPGILGSNLCVFDQGIPVERLWGGRESLRNLDRLSLLPGEEEDGIGPCGAIESVQVLGPFEIQQYELLFDYLESLGYEAGDDLYRFEPGDTLLVFAYDWRRSNLDNAQHFATFVDEQPGLERFDVLAHSMGGLVARTFIARHDHQGQVDRFVTLGTPHNGSLRVLYTAHEGWGWWQNLIAGGMPNIRRTVLSWPSIYEMLPSPQSRCCELVDVDSSSSANLDLFVAENWRDLSWVPEHYRYGEGWAYLRNNLARAVDLRRAVDAELPDSVHFFTIANGILRTEDRMYVDRNSGEIRRWRKGRGDGAVTEWSAADGAVARAHYADAEHGQIYRGRAAEIVLRRSLLGSTEYVAGGGFHQLMLVDASGSAHAVDSLDLQLEPQVLHAGATSRFTITVGAEEAFQDGVSFLPRVSLISPDGQTDLAIGSTDISNGEAIMRGEFTAPSGEGAVRISVELAGMRDPIERVVFVLQGG